MMIDDDRKLINETTNDMILSALRATDRPMTAAEVRAAVRVRSNIRLSRQAIYGALGRMATRSLIYSLDDQGKPRVWAAIPDLP